MRRALKETVLQKSADWKPEHFLAGWRAAEDYHRIPAHSSPEDHQDRYRKRPEIRAMMKKVGVTNRDLAAVVGLSPSTVGAKLTGYQPMNPGEAEMFMGCVTGWLSSKSKKGKENL